METQEQHPTVRILGVVDELGYLFCSSCVDVTDFDRGYVWSDQFAHVDEPCELCRRPLNRPELATGVVEYADEHESGQLRIAVAGEQVPLLPLPDELIPTIEETEA